MSTEPTPHGVRPAIALSTFSWRSWWVAAALAYVAVPGACGAIDKYLLRQDPLAFDELQGLITTLEVTGVALAIVLMLYIVAVLVLRGRRREVG